jgi:hypothetical protein
MQDPNATQSKKDSSDWLQGYCYQMWRCRHNAFRGDGAFGQFMIVMPEQDAALAITAETPNMQEEINLVWQYLLPSFNDKSLPANANAANRLKEKIRTLALLPPAKNNESYEAAVNGKTFAASTNSMQLESIEFNFSGGDCRVNFQTNTSRYDVVFGAGKWQPGETNLPGPSLTGALIENRSMIYPAKIMAAYSWKDANTLELTVRYIESPHTETYLCHFHDNSLIIEASRSLDYGKNNAVIEAREK